MREKSIGKYKLSGNLIFLFYFHVALFFGLLRKTSKNNNSIIDNNNNLKLDELCSSTNTKLILENIFLETAIIYISIEIIQSKNTMYGILLPSLIHFNNKPQVQVQKLVIFVQ